MAELSGGTVSSSIITGLTAGLLLFGSAGGGISQDANLAYDGTTLTLAPKRSLFSPVAATSGSFSKFQYIGSSDTTLAASVDPKQVRFALGNQELSTGALATYSGFRIEANAVAFTGASVITRLANLVLTTPSVGANATATNLDALLIEGTSTVSGIRFSSAARIIGESSLNFRTAAAITFDITAAAATFTINSGPWVFNSNRFTVSSDSTAGALRFVKNAGPGGARATCFDFVSTVAETGITAGLEAIGFRANLSADIGHLTGGITTQRAFVIDAPTYSFVGGSVIATAATFAITGAPIAGSSATLTNSFALWCQAGAALFDGGAQVIAGAATQKAKVGGTLTQNVTAVGNSTGGEDDLITYSLPANTLNATGETLEMEAWGTFAVNATTKRLRLYFGATVLFDTGALVLNGNDWFVKIRVVRTGAATQDAVAHFEGNIAVVTVTADFTTPTETLSGAITIKGTGLSGAGAAANDIVMEGLRVAWSPANT